MKVRFFLCLILGVVSTSLLAQRKHYNDWEGKLSLNAFYSFNKESHIKFNSKFNTYLQNEYDGAFKSKPLNKISDYNVGLSYWHFFSDKMAAVLGSNYTKNFSYNGYNIFLEVMHFGKIGNKVSFNKKISVVHSRFEQPKSEYSYILPENRVSFSIGFAYEIQFSNKLKISPFINYEAYRLRDQSTSKHKVGDRKYRFMDRTELKTGFSSKIKNNISLNVYTSRLTNFYLTEANADCNQLESDNCKLNIINPVFGIDLYVFIRKKQDENETLITLPTLLD